MALDRLSSQELAARVDEILVDSLHLPRRSTRPAALAHALEFAAIDGVCLLHLGADAAAAKLEAVAVAQLPTAKVLTVVFKQVLAEALSARAADACRYWRSYCQELAVAGEACMGRKNLVITCAAFSAGGNSVVDHVQCTLLSGQEVGLFRVPRESQLICSPTGAILDRNLDWLDEKLKNECCRRSTGGLVLVNIAGLLLWQDRSYQLRPLPAEFLLTLTRADPKHFSLERGHCAFEPGSRWEIRGSTARNILQFRESFRFHSNFVKFDGKSKTVRVRRVSSCIPWGSACWSTEVINDSRGQHALGTLLAGWSSVARIVEDAERFFETPPHNCTELELEAMLFSHRIILPDLPFCLSGARRVLADIDGRIIAVATHGSSCYHVSIAEATDIDVEMMERQ